jgi:hypothetical protein
MQMLAVVPLALIAAYGAQTRWLPRYFRGRPLPKPWRVVFPQHPWHSPSTC